MDKEKRKQPTLTRRGEKTSPTKIGRKNPTDKERKKKTLLTKRGRRKGY